MKFSSVLLLKQGSYCFLKAISLFLTNHFRLTDCCRFCLISVTYAESIAMNVFSLDQMSPQKRKSPQSVIAEVRIEGVNALYLFLAYVQSGETMVRLAECQNKTSDNWSFLGKT